MKLGDTRKTLATVALVTALELVYATGTWIIARKWLIRTWFSHARRNVKSAIKWISNAWWPANLATLTSIRAAIIARQSCIKLVSPITNLSAAPNCSLDRPTAPTIDHTSTQVE